MPNSSPPRRRGLLRGAAVTSLQRRAGGGGHRKRLITPHHTPIPAWATECLEGGAYSKNELFTIALIKMRRGKSNMELAGDVGVARSNFGTAVVAWIFKLGAFAKHTLIGIPDMEYILQSMPESFMECSMGGVVAVSDATDILCKTVRVAYMQQV
ncbi:hypothetical protein T492DRAFT_855683 [Pavlovales sp. CCMP2436]|nr:hypothetical protein T492DRAFT_855683 [Pavlovales sp. CCMP2436]